ncbi:genetic competence negative regulator [Pullulanibacillus sp. KACC 23026]|uniref:genetic competence negative regulator n=1 Tax=Pullulanibacillus sp. KACC 23026 TaxID=3028315 RepID=UPI0023AEEAAA|nr:genetic competence negative regulator [Pullulanibacillus sp. KACC 23026]WEG11399.1 genetic competence negative regulator [Pullulanibacillus sp. KACC 23026]
MRLERLNSDKIKIFLTFDDLQERGLSKDDLWSNLPKVQDLFREMIMEADDELGFQADGPIEVEVFSLPAQGMVIIVSKSVDTDFIDEDDPYIEMQVTLDESDVILYRFNDIEEVISLAEKLTMMGESGGRLFVYEKCYYLEFTPDDIQSDEETFVAVLAEYGTPSTLTHHRLEEYGQELLGRQAIKQLCMYFN